MLSYLLKRLFWMVPLLVGISLISFLIMHLAPGILQPAKLALTLNPVRSPARSYVKCTTWISL